MSTSCYNSNSVIETTSLMSQSLDPSILNETIQTPVQSKQHHLKEINGITEKNLDGKTFNLFACIIL